MKLKQIYEEISNGRIGQISEASLSRLLSMVQNKDFCIATAFRYGNSLQTNRNLNKTLLSTLNSQKMGGYQLIGHWQEAPDGVDYQDAKPNELTDSVEESILFVKPDNMDRNKFVTQCARIAKQFNQDAVVVGLANEGVHLVFKDGDTHKVGDKVALNKTAQAYSQMKKKPNIPFVFEGMLEPTSNISKQAFKARNIKYLI